MYWPFRPFIQTNSYEPQKTRWNTNRAKPKEASSPWTKYNLSMHLADYWLEFMMLGASIMAQFSWFGAPTCRIWLPRLDQCPAWNGRIVPLASIASSVCITWSPSMHLSVSCTAFMVLGAGIMAQFSWFGAPTCRIWLPRLDHCPTWMGQIAPLTCLVVGPCFFPWITIRLLFSLALP